MTIARLSAPLGTAIKSLAHVSVPQQADYEGKFIVLSPINPQVDAEELYRVHPRFRYERADMDLHELRTL